jgi:nitrite reductase/ring-hydroxylating ferredoxin subunit
MKTVVCSFLLLLFSFQVHSAQDENSFEMPPKLAHACSQARDKYHANVLRQKFDSSKHDQVKAILARCTNSADRATKAYCNIIIDSDIVSFFSEWQFEYHSGELAKDLGLSPEETIDLINEGLMAHNEGPFKELDEQMRHANDVSTIKKEHVMPYGVVCPMPEKLEELCAKNSRTYASEQLQNLFKGPWIGCANPEGGAAQTYCKKNDINRSGCPLEHGLAWSVTRMGQESGMQPDEIIELIEQGLYALDQHTRLKRDQK